MILRVRRDRRTRTSNVALNRSSRTKRNTSSLVINLFSVQSSRYATMPLFSFRRSPMVAGPSLRQARHCRLPLCQGLPTSHPRCIQRTTGDDTDDLAAERKAELAPRGTYGRSGRGRNASTAARVRRGWDDLLGDAGGLLAVKSAREGHHYRCGGAAH
jgi:hypothetical protein